MHHLGDQLVRLEFELPIIDVDWMVAQYETEDELLRELQAEGFNNLSANRRKTLTGKGHFRAFLNHLRKICENQGSTALTLEVMYGYAKKSDKQSSEPSKIEVRPPVW